MEKIVQNIPFLRLAIALIIGILIGQYIDLNVVTGLYLLFILLSALLFFNLKYRYSLALMFGICANLFFVLLGIVIYNRHNEKPVFHSHGTYIATVLENVVEKPNSLKSTVTVNTVLWPDSAVKTNEKIIVYFEKNNNAICLKPGDEIIFNNTPNEVAKKLNPNDFDYRQYLEERKIYRQVFLAAENWQKTGNSAFSLICEAEKLRNNLINVYRSQPIDTVEFEILSALTLGYSRELDPETKKTFMTSGATHVLSVSGLHVAIIFAVLNFIFGFLKRNKNGRFVFMAVVILILWFYAFITGLSPSVMRATAMFSVYLFGENINRKSNIFNSLALTAFFLLLINPNSLFDIGFQLSYTALFGIVVIEPKLSKLFVIKNRVLRYFISLITVSLAAQIATFPLTSYYFSQFPTYFVLTNLFIIPAVAFLTPVGIFLLFVYQIPIVADIVSFVLNTVLKFSYKLLLLIDQLPYAVFQVTVNQLQLLLISGLIIATYFILTHFNAKHLKAMLVFLLLFSVSVLVEQVKIQKTSQIIVYNSTRNTILHLIRGKENYVISEEPILPQEMQYSPFTATQKKLGLNNPVKLLACDSMINSVIFFKNREIHFQGNSIYFGNKTNQLPENTEHCLFINPSQPALSISNTALSTVIITNKKYLPKSSNNNSLIYCTFNKGAYQKIW